MGNKLYLLIFLTSFWEETQGSPSPSIQNTCKDTYKICKYGAKSACDCKEAVANGWCSNDPYTINNCRLSCGLCQAGSPNSVAAIVSEVPISVYRGPCDPNPCGLSDICEVKGKVGVCIRDPCDPNPCGSGNICEVQGGAGTCKTDMKAFFGGKNVTSNLPDGPAPEEAPETEAAPVVQVTESPVKAVAEEVGAPAIVPIAGEQYAPITDAPIRPIAATPKDSIVGQLGPIAERPYAFAVAPVTPVVAPMAPVAAPVAPVVAPVAPVIAPVAPVVAPEVPNVDKHIVAVTRAPPDFLINQDGYTPLPPMAELRSDQVTDAPIVPIAMTPDAIVAPPPMAEYPEGMADPPPTGRDNPAGWGYRQGRCDPNPCGPNTKCAVAPNGLPRCRCKDDFVPNDNTIVGCKPMCTSNDECPGDYSCKRSTSKCVRVCGPGACGLKADCDGYQHRAICNCPEGYTGDPDVQCVRAARNLDAESGGAAIGKFVYPPMNNRISELQEPDSEIVRVVHQDTGEPVGEEEAAEALETLAIAKESEAATAAAGAEKRVDEQNNAIRENVSFGVLLLSMILIVQI